MKNLLTILSLLWLQSSASTFYCTNSTEFRSRLGSAVPGDFIYLLKGVTFTGSFSLTKNATAAANIYVGAYGVLPAATIRGSFDISGKYWVVDGLNFADSTMQGHDLWTEANVSSAVEFGGSYNTVRNCNVAFVGCGFNLTGTYNTIENNTVHDLFMIKNTDGGDDDYGAVAVVLSGAYNTIRRNTVYNCWAFSYDYDFDGGVVDYYGGGTHGNKIIYNTTWNNNGFVEFGSGNGGASNDNLLAYNLSINNGEFAYVNGSGQYAIAVNNLMLYNNIMIETQVNFSGLPSMIAFNSSSSMIMRNNIFQISSGKNVARSGTNLMHENNIYKLSGGSGLGFAIGASERTTTAALFTSTTGNASAWNYRPLSTSPALNAGQWVGIERDIISTPVAPVPDAGTYEYLSTTAIPVPTIPIIPIIPPFVWNNQQKIVITAMRFDEWVLYDLAGRRLAARKYRIGRNEIDISLLAHGVYLLKTEFKTYKIIK